MQTYTKASSGESEDTLEEAIRYKLKKVFESLVTSGRPTLSETKVASIKAICQMSETHVDLLYECIQKWLKKKHSEIRLSTFQICIEIFDNSHHFRTLLLEDFVFITNQTILGSASHPLPKPENTAKALINLAIKTIHNWFLKFGTAYPNLYFGHKYLRQCKDVDFERAAIITPSQLETIILNERKLQKRQDRRIRKVTQDMAANLEQMNSSLVEYRNGFSLMIPDVDHFMPTDVDAAASNDFDAEFGSDFMRHCGITKNTEVTINLRDITKIQETNDNEIVINALREQVRLMQKCFLPKVREWSQLVMEYTSAHPQLMKQIIDIKMHLQSAVRKFTSLTILPNIQQASPCDTDDSDNEDMIDVPVPPDQDKPLSEVDFLALHLTSKTEPTDRDLLDAGPSGLNKPKRTQISKQKTKVSKLFIEEYDDVGWEQPLKFLNSAVGDNPVWGANDVLHEKDDTKRPNLLGLTTQRIDFKREFKPVKRMCRAPLPSGRLCPRKDREVCPLHGIVVPRDPMGNPVDPEDLKREHDRLAAKERENPAWQDPALLADIKRETGVDLDMRKLKSRKRKYEHLTDVSKGSSLARERLSKKIFSKKTMARINKQLSK